MDVSGYIIQFIITLYAVISFTETERKEACADFLVDITSYHSEEHNIHGLGGAILNDNLKQDKHRQTDRQREVK